MSVEAQIARARPVSDVIIVDDHPLYNDALEAAVTQGFGDCCVRKSQTLAETFEILESGFSPDFVLFDLKLPDVTGISGFQKLRDRLPEARILVISSLSSVELVQSLLKAGAMGFLQKDASADTLTQAIQKIAAGQRYVPRAFLTAEMTQETCLFDGLPELSHLTPQQINILKLIRAGKPNKQIAYELSLAEATVKAHITALFRRLDVSNRTQAVVFVDAILARQSGQGPEVRAFLRH